MKTSKRRKLTFNEHVCCFCQKKFGNNKTVLDPSKSNLLFTKSKERTDEVSVNITANEENIISGVLKLCYHKSCRSKYLHPFYNEKINEDLLENVENGAKFTRAQVQTEFDWRTNCFICGNKCSRNHRGTWSRIERSINETSKLYSKLLEQSSLRGNNELHARLLSSNGDLVAVEARFHRNPKGCLAHYVSERNINTFRSLPEESKLEKAGTILKAELKEKIEVEKSVFELSYLKSRLTEICESNNITIGKRKLKANYVKKALSRIWPELRFIPRKSLSDLVCSNAMKAEDALSKYFELEKSFQDLDEEDECSTNLGDSFIDSESDEVSILHQAAVILRQRIS